MKLIRWVFVYSIILLFFNNCQPDKLEVDVSKENIPDLKMQRMDREMFTITPLNEREKNIELEKEYGTFYNRFITNILHLSGTDSSKVVNFVRDKTMMEVYNECQKLFTDDDVSNVETEFTDAVKRFHHFFPNRKYPKKLVAFMGGFNASVAYDTLTNTIGFGIEKYLGREHNFYNLLQTPKYQTLTMSKEYIVSDMVRGWMITEFDNADPTTNLLSHMIFFGKIFYACDALLPKVQDSIKIGYTTTQMRYCKEAEKFLWGFFAEKNRLYENDMKLINEFTLEGPFTRAISRECPPRIAMWTGWQIVRNYMKNNESVTIEQLMAEKDFVKILSKSKYRP